MPPRSGGFPLQPSPPPTPNHRHRTRPQGRPFGAGELCHWQSPARPRTGRISDRPSARRFDAPERRRRPAGACDRRCAQAHCRRDLNRQGQIGLAPVKSGAESRLAGTKQNSRNYQPRDRNRIGSGTMAEILDFELGSSRLRVKRAEKSLKRAEEGTDRKNGVVNIALCCRIRAAQQRVTEAPGAPDQYLYVGGLQITPNGHEMARSCRHDYTV